MWRGANTAVIIVVRGPLTTDHIQRNVSLGDCIIM